MKPSTLLIVTLVVVLAASIGAASSAAQGNAEAAEMCRESGYLDFTTQTGEPFANTGECVSYVATGGDLKSRDTTAVGSTVTVTRVIWQRLGPILVLYFAGTDYTYPGQVALEWSHPAYWTTATYHDLVEPDGTIVGYMGSPSLYGQSCIPGSAGSLTVRDVSRQDVLATDSYTLVCPE